jgi:ribosome maturation factor RimP
VSKTSNRDDLLRLLAPVVTGLGLDLEDVAVQSAGRRHVLRVVVDRDGGVGLDTVAEVSTAVSAVLDESEAMGGRAYVLEVTSPGVDRPLTQPRHWRRARSRLVQAGLADGGTATGRVVEVGDDGVRLDVSGEEQLLAWPDVVSGRVQVEFNRKTGRE